MGFVIAHLIGLSWDACQSAILAVETVDKVGHRLARGNPAVRWEESTESESESESVKARLHV